jgi:signal transduction histidine kinase/DNA-binding response OmpR family regulator
MEQAEHMKRTTFLIALFALIVEIMFQLSPGNILLSQDKPNIESLYTHSGFKYFKNFTAKEYQQNAQNWAVVQDNRGIIYVASQGGLLEYDGVSWRTINIPNIFVRSLATDGKGKLFIGGKDEFGVAIIDARGALQYQSLVPLLKPYQRDFSNVWRTHWTKEGAYYYTTKFLFRWNPNTQTLKVWSPEPGFPFRTSFICAGEFYIRLAKKGLARMTANSLVLVPGGELFKDKKIYMITPMADKNDSFLIGTRENGFFIYNGKVALPFPTQADEFLREKKLYHGTRLQHSQGQYAMATLLGGLLIMGAKGNIKQIYDKSVKLQDNNVKYVFEDSEGNLWLALNNGIAKIEYASPFAIYDDRSNLGGQVLAVKRHYNRLYVGTTTGLYTLRPPGKFSHIKGLFALNFQSLLPAGYSLLAAASTGVLQINLKDDTHRQIIKGPAYTLLRSTKNPHRVWAGINKGLISMRLKSIENEPSIWQVEHQFKTVTQQIKSIVEDPDGNLWLGTPTKGVIKISLQCDKDVSKHRVKHYNSPGLLPAGEINIFNAAGHTIFASPGKGIFRFNENEQTFSPDFTLGDGFAGGSKGVFRILEDKQGNIWFHSKSQSFKASQLPGSQSYSLPAINPLLRIPVAQVHVIYPDQAVTWFGSTDGLIGYRTSSKKETKTEFKALIREVIINGNTLLYDSQNNQYKKFQDDNTNSTRPLLIAYKDRNLRFRFAAPYFQGESDNQFRSFLQGYEENWSDWGSESWRDFTNLDAGRTTFRVQAKNTKGEISQDAVFHFRILPPWFNTWWAFSIYGLLSILAVYGIVRWRFRKLERETKKLEATVEQRTKEIHQKNKQLESQTQQLQEQAEKLKELSEVKSRFFANISHEFRTPLTLIMGPLEHIQEEYKDKDSDLENKISLMLRNSQRLFTLINRLLDLSKLDSGKMNLIVTPQKIVPFIKGIIASFDFIVLQHRLQLVLKAPQDEELILYFDHEKIEDVLCNLLINAVKFTPDEGKITITIKRNLCKAEHFPGGYIEISIADTGPGIPRQQMAQIFDRFYQAEKTFEHHRQGFGIGLALTRELIALHSGRIDVHSHTGKDSGTEFIIRLPIGKDHFEANEIYDPAKIPHSEDKKEPFKIPVSLTLEKELVASSKTGKTLPQVEAPVAKSDDSEIILVVEDNADVRAYIRDALQPQYSVIEAGDGQEGIDKARELIPDLIISDIMMPLVDGYQLCQTLKEDIQTSHIPIIILTAKASERNIIQGLETGANDYITKPFSTKILNARVKNLIDLRRHFQLTLYREMTRQPVNMSVSKLDKEFIKELQEMIEKNLSNTDFNVESLGKKMYMSRATLYRKIHALSGESPNEFIQSYRLKRAAELLEKNFGTVLEVSFEVGFASSSYFTKCFKKKFNRLPSTFTDASAGHPTAAS